MNILEVLVYQYSSDEFYKFKIDLQIGLALSSIYVSSISHKGSALGNYKNMMEAFRSPYGILYLDGNLVRGFLIATQRIDLINLN